MWPDIFTGIFGKINWNLSQQQLTCLVPLIVLLSFICKVNNTLVPWNKTSNGTKSQASSNGNHKWNANNHLINQWRNIGKKERENHGVSALYYSQSTCVCYIKIISISEVMPHFECIIYAMNIFSNGKISWKQKSYVKERKITCIRMKKVLFVTRNYAKPDSSLFDSKMKTSEQKSNENGWGGQVAHLLSLNYVLHMQCKYELFFSFKSI